MRTVWQRCTARPASAGKLEPCPPNGEVRQWFKVAEMGDIWFSENDRVDRYLKIGHYAPKGRALRSSGQAEAPTSWPRNGHGDAVPYPGSPRSRRALKTRF